MGYLVVNKNEEFRIFQDIPYRTKREITETSKTDFDWDYHGHHRYKEIPTGKFNEFWCRDWGEDRGCMRGTLINKFSLNSDLQEMTWEDEPIEI